MAAAANPNPAPDTAKDGASKDRADATVVGAAPPADAGTGSTADIGDITPLRDSRLLGANLDPDGSMLGRGIVGAILGHVALAALVVLHPTDIATWSGGGAGDGVDIELISSRDLTIAEPTRASADSAVSTPMVTQPAPEPTPAVEKTALLKPADVPDPDTLPLDTATAIDTPKPAVDVPPTPVEQPPVLLQPKVEQTAAPTNASEASRTAVDRDRQTAGSARREGADTAATVAATAGEIDAYKLSMVEAIDRCKPKDSKGSKGSVWINYYVDPDGSIGLAYVDRSSGLKNLDTLALDALRGCRFRPPLPGLERDQRFYSIPFIFK